MNRWYFKIKAMRSPLENDAEFSNFFHEHYTRLVIFAFRFTNELEAAEDITVESFVKLWNKRNSLEDIRSFKAYLYTTTRNRCVTWIRSNKREAKRKETAANLAKASEGTILDEMIYTESIIGIMAAMNRLPNQCKKVFVLHYVEGKKLTDIAKELKISIGTVYSHKYRGIDLLQKALLTLFIIFLGKFFW